MNRRILKQLTFINFIKFYNNLSTLSVCDIQFKLMVLLVYYKIMNNISVIRNNDYVLILIQFACHQ